MPDKISNYLTAGTDMSQEVYEANRPYYSSMYSSLDRARQIAANRVKESYADQMGSTYLQGQQAMANIGSSALGSNYKTYLQNQLQENINKAYDNYLSQQQQDISKVTSAYDQSINNLTNYITSEGQKLGDYSDRYATGLIQYGGEYLTKSDYFKLRDYANYEDYKNAKGILTEEQFWKQNKYLEYYDYKAYLEDQIANGILSEEQFNRKKRQAEIDYKMFEGLYDEQGNVNWENVKTALYAKRDEAGEIVTDQYGNAIMDESGELSTLGKNIFDYLAAYDKEGFENYQNWLEKKDKDLFEWSIQRSILGDPSNARTAWKRLGADGTYSFVERFGGLTEKQTQEIFSNFEVNLKELGKNENFDNVKKVIQDIKSFYNDLGLSDLEIELKDDEGNLQKGSVGKLLDELANAKNGKSLEVIWNSAQSQIDYYNEKSMEYGTKAAGTAAATGAFTAGTALIPVVGWFLAPVVAGTGTTATATYIAIASEYGDLAKDRAKNRDRELQDAFQAFALSSAAIAKEMRNKTVNKNK